MPISILSTKGDRERSSCAFVALSILGSKGTYHLVSLGVIIPGISSEQNRSGFLSSWQKVKFSVLYQMAPLRHGLIDLEFFFLHN